MNIINIQEILLKSLYGIFIVVKSEKCFYVFPRFPLLISFHTIKFSTRDYLQEAHNLNFYILCQIFKIMILAVRG